MTPEKFMEVLKERTSSRLSTMEERAKTYSRFGDRLHNFKRAAAMKQSTPERALEGMMSKQITTMYDYLDDLDKDTHKGPKQWEEILGDISNYIDLLYALLHERYEW